MKCPHCKKNISEKEVAAHLGSIGGKASKGKTSDKKKLASRLNGKMGGRPKGAKNKTKKETAK